MTQHASRFSRESGLNAEATSRPRKVKRPVVANAQRTKIDLEREEREQIARTNPAPFHTSARSQPLSKRQGVSIASAIESYIQDHVGGNHSPKTVEWHQTAPGLLQAFLEQEEGLTGVREIEADHLTRWFTFMRKYPGARQKLRSERTIQTYARSVRAFFHWLIRRQLLETNPFALVTFPKVGKPLIQTITAEEFESLLAACTPPNETGPIAERAAVRNRAILWVFYDTGIRVSELCHLRIENLDRKRGVLTVSGKGSKERRIALGQNCQRHLLYYLDHHRPDAEELSEWGSAGEDHLFLSETRLPITKNGITLLFARLKKRVGITGRRISPHIFRHTFAIRYLVNGGDPFSLQELLGHEDMATVKIYMRMNDETIQEQKRKFSPGDHLPTRLPGPRQARRTSFNARTTSPKTRRK